MRVPRLLALTAVAVAWFAFPAGAHAAAAPAAATPNCELYCWYDAEGLQCHWIGCGGGGGIRCYPACAHGGPNPSLKRDQRTPVRALLCKE